MSSGSYSNIGKSIGKQAPELLTNDGAKTQRGQLMKLQHEREMLMQKKQKLNQKASKQAYETIGIQSIQQKNNH